MDQSGNMASDRFQEGRGCGVGVSELCGEGERGWGTERAHMTLVPSSSGDVTLNEDRLKMWQGWRDISYYTLRPKRQKYLGHDEWCLNLACLTHKSIKAGE